MYQDKTVETASSNFSKELLEFCYHESNPPPRWASAQTVHFWIEGVMLSLTGIFGIFGNILTCLVLRRISLNNVFNQLIAVLASVDSVFAAFCIINYSLKKGFKLISYTTPIFVNLWPVIVYPLLNITYSVSCFVTCAIAIERWVMGTSSTHDRQKKHINWSLSDTWPSAIRSLSNDSVFPPVSTKGTCLDKSYRILHRGIATHQTCWRRELVTIYCQHSFSPYS